MNKGQPEVIKNAVVAAGDAVKRYIRGYNAVIVHHEISGGAAGGFVGLKMGGKEDGTFIAHHGKGTNIKAAASATSYIAVFEGLMDWIEVSLTVTDGTHTVTIQPINV